MFTTLVVVAIIILILGLMYNSLTSKKNHVEDIFGLVNTQLKKRYDLIPNLISSVSEYMQQEKTLLESVTSIRSKAIKHNLEDTEVISLDKKMVSALSSLMIAFDTYPEIKANENLLKIQASLNQIEEQIQAARETYNQAVTKYNLAIDIIPINYMAKIMSYKKKVLFNIDKT
ncbi:MAG: LemA family protein [Arcobacter sp.]|nr:MAG: LemA family protein [Arcobacter sp.]